MTASDEGTCQDGPEPFDPGKVEGQGDNGRQPGFVLGYYEGWADAKANRQYGEGRCGRRPGVPDHPICGIVSLSGPNGEPLACGLPLGHDARHAWASLPSFTLMSSETAHVVGRYRGKAG